MPVSRWLLIPLSLGLFACASNEPKPPKTTESFVTSIQADNSKQFNYTLIMEKPKRRGENRAGHEPDQNDLDPDDDSFYDGLKHLTEEGLLAKLEDSGYCRSGYVQLETQSKRGAMNITGECYDKATDADRSKFPNPAPKKIIEERLD